MILQKKIVLNETVKISEKLAKSMVVWKRENC